MPLFYDTRTFICPRVSSWHGILSSKPFFCVLTCNVIARKDPISIKKSIGALAPSLVTWNPEFCHRSEPSYVIFLYFRKQSLWALSPLYNWVWQIPSQSFPRRWMGQLPFIPAVTFLMPAFCCWGITHYSAEKEAGELEFSAMDIERKSDLRETENETR